MIDNFKKDHVINFFLTKLEQLKTNKKNKITFHGDLNICYIKIDNVTYSLNSLNESIFLTLNTNKDILKFNITEEDLKKINKYLIDIFEYNINNHNISYIKEIVRQYFLSNNSIINEKKIDINSSEEKIKIYLPTYYTFGRLQIKKISIISLKLIVSQFKEINEILFTADDFLKFKCINHQFDFTECLKNNYNNELSKYFQFETIKEKELLDKTIKDLKKTKIKKI